MWNAIRLAGQNPCCGGIAGCEPRSTSRLCHSAGYSYSGGCCGPALILCEPHVSIGGQKGVRQMEAILKLIAPIHRKLRAQKCNLFFEALKPQRGDSLLDVGGGTGILGEFGRIYRYFTVVQVVNLDTQKIEEEGLEHVRCGVADGCSLPFPDHS